MLNSKNNYSFLTGCTGALGSFILKKLIGESKDVIFLLIRDKNDDSLRIKKLFGDFLKINLEDNCYKKRIKIIRGDITQDFLGLNNKVYNNLCKKISYIYHCAASTNLRNSFEELSLQNINGTKNILKLANNCPHLKSLNYVSSMFIAGNFKGNFTEKRFNVKQEFNNSYEKSKFLAEGLIRKNFNLLYNSNIYRPSVIMGAYSTGVILRTSNLYIPVYFFKRKLFDSVPVTLSTRHNIVPVDLAASAIFLLSRNENGNNVFNICSSSYVTLFEIFKKASLVLKYRNPKFINIKKFSFDSLSGAQKVLLNPMIPYLNYNGKFKAEITNNKLKRLGFNWPDLDDKYFYRIFNYVSKASTS